MRARVQRGDVREQPVSIKNVSSFVLYDDQDYAIFAFYADFGGVVHYAAAGDDDFQKIHTLATGDSTVGVARVSDLNLKKVE
tara:strand:+ start:75 stop:320 length:246 start_codon:yes stop_codon:yes gene_type:complete